jgi:leucyl aminopeptidase
VNKLFAPRLEVTFASLDDELALAEAAAAPVVAFGVPVLEAEDGSALADDLPDQVSALAQPLAPDPQLCASQGFSGKVGQVMVVLSSSGGPAAVYLGCGERDEIATEVFRRTGAALVRAAGRSGVAVFVLPAALAGPGPGAHRSAAQAVSEGAVLAAYRFSSHKTKSDSAQVERVVVAGVGLDEGAAREGVANGNRVATAVCAARDLVNEPPSSMTPRRLAEAAAQLLGPASGVTLEIWDEDRIEAERLGGLLGVARGSAEPPRLLRAQYEPPSPLTVDGRVPHIVLVGKGITFDSGGLSLKGAESMMTMKTDMSGAATVLATVSACADLGVRVRVSAIAPVTENMPGGKATKPGDVLVIRDGQTIEVLNTDAEGRLVLADGLSLAAELQPDAIIDLATLTGAAVVALGGSIAGLFGNDQALVDKVREAGSRAGEATWQLPLAKEYRSHIKSEVADMKNIGKAGQAGAIAAALLLERFVGEIPWVHIDIAGPARSDEDEGVLTKGGTGFGVRTVLELLRAYGGDPTA